MLLCSTSFADLRFKLLFYERILKYKKDRNLVMHQAFVATTGNVPGQGGTKGNNYKGNHNNMSKGHRGRINKSTKLGPVPFRFL